MRASKLLRVVLFATVVGAGLVGPAAYASEQTDGPAISGLIADDKDDKAKPGGKQNQPEPKDDKEKPKDKPADDKDKAAKDKLAGNDKDDKANVGKDKNKADKEKGDKITKANGNAGAIFVKSGPTAGPGNQPHVGCEFYVSGMNFSSTSGTVEFYAWKPTGSFQPVKPITGPSTYTGTDSNFLNGPYSLPTDGQTPHAQQGYHYKVEAINADGKKVNSKVFWVDCKPTTTGGNTATQPNATITATPTPTPTPGPTLPPGTTPSATPPATGTPITTPLSATTSGTSDATAGTPANPAAPSTGSATTAPVTVVLTMPITVDGTTGSIDLPAGTTITVPTGTVLTSLPGAPAPARQFVEVEAGTVLGTTAHGAVTSDEEAVGEVVLGEQASILPTALPRTGGAPLGAAAALGAAIVLAGVVGRRRSAA